MLWARVVERNRRDVEEKSEQLKAVASMAALVAGFSLTGFLQVTGLWGILHPCVTPLHTHATAAVCIAHTRLCCTHTFVYVPSPRSVLTG